MRHIIMLAWFVAGCSALPTQGLPTAGARLGVLKELFPSSKMPAVEYYAPLMSKNFAWKRQAALRWRVAQARAAVGRATREIDALEACDMRKPE